MPAGENSKNYPTFENVCEAIISARVERNDLVVALGGGVIGDLADLLRLACDAGWISCRYRRPFSRKSILGRRQDRHQFAPGQESDRRLSPASAVIADTALLDTLPGANSAPEHAEVAKYGLLGDAAFFAWLEKTGRTYLREDLRASTPLRFVVAARRESLRAMSARPASVPCLIWVTPSAMLWKLASDSTGYCMERRWHSAWRWHSRSRHKED